MDLLVHVLREEHMKDWKLGACLGLAVALGSAAQAETYLRYGEGGPNRGSRAEAVQYFAEQAAELSEEVITVDIIWGGALLKTTTAFDGVSDGVADLGSMLVSYKPQELLPLTVGDIPVGTSDPWVGMRAMYEFVTTTPEIEAELARRGIVYLSNFSSTGVQFECTKGNEINTVGDIKGKKIRATGTYAKILADLGANLVTLDFGDVYQALDTGLIDCSAAYFYTNNAYKIYEVIDQVTRADWGQVSGYAIFMNKRRFDELPEAQKEALVQAGDRMVDHFAEALLEEIDRVAGGMESGEIGNKVPVVAMEPAARQELLDAGQPYVGRWIEDMTARGFDGQALWEKYSALVAKYEDDLAANGYPWVR
jgi:TRAP-type transport system periplasmic protein